MAWAATAKRIRHEGDSNHAQLLLWLDGFTIVRRFSLTAPRGERYLLIRIDRSTFILTARIVAIHLSRAFIAVVFLATAVRADGPADNRGQGTDPNKSAIDARALAARIDAVLAARWSAAKVRPAEIADDGEFLSASVST